MALVAKAAPKDWIIDTGATSHLTGDYSTLRNVQSIALEPIQGLSSTVLATKQGEVTLRVVLSNGSESLITLGNVLYVPGLPLNLISITTLRQYSAWFHSGKCVLYNNKNKEVAYTPKRNGLFYLRVAPTPLITDEAASAPQHQE